MVGWMTKDLGKFKEITLFHENRKQKLIDAIAHENAEIQRFSMCPAREIYTDSMPDIFNQRVSLTDYKLNTNVWRRSSKRKISLPKKSTE